jgi:hypothetical protein
LKKRRCNFERIPFTVEVRIRMQRLKKFLRARISIASAFRWTHRERAVPGATAVGDTVQGDVAKRWLRGAKCGAGGRSYSP